MSRSVTNHYAHLACRISFEQLSRNAVARAKASIIDAVGCMLAGSSSAEGIMAQKAGLADGVGSAALVGAGIRLSPTYAALANGTAGHAHDYDDSSPQMIGHPSVPIVAAMLSMVTGKDVSGREIIVAFVAGLEIAAGLGRRMNPPHYQAGWHATATLGTLAAAVAASRIGRLDERQTAHAIGIAASTCAGIRKNFGSMVKPLHAGLAARNGVLAAQLAAAGITADIAALDGENGFIDVFRGRAAMPEFELGGPLEIERSGIGIKRYPCCGCTHSALDAMLSLKAGAGFAGEDVASISCMTSALATEILVYHRPVTAAQAKFSMEYCLAVAALDAACGLDQFEPERVSDAGVQELLGRVETIVDPAISYRNGVYPATVSVRLRDGTTFSASAEEARGHPDLPLSAAELEEKFVSCAGRVLDERRVSRIYSSFACLDEIGSVKPLVYQLALRDNASDVVTTMRAASMRPAVVEARAPT